MTTRKRIFNSQFEVTELEVTLEDQTYHLVPGHQYDLRNHFEKTHGYGELNRLSRKRFDRDYIIKDCPVVKDHQTCLRGVLPAAQCAGFIEQHSKDPNSVETEEFMLTLLPRLMTPEIESQLCSYFKSEFTLLWFSYLETATHTDKERRAYSSYWHCDGGPERHLKMLIYLNDYDSHGGNTKFLCKSTTDRLKDAGYIFGDNELRSDDLGPLCRDRDVPYEPIMYDDIKAGDALLFNPNQLAHIGKIPDKAHRHVLQLCFIPSPFSWQDTVGQIIPPETRCIDFADDYAHQLIQLVDDGPVVDHEEVIVPAGNGISSKAQLKFLLRNMFADADKADKMSQHLLKIDPQLTRIKTLTTLMDVVKTTLRDGINWEGQLGEVDIANLAQIARFEEEMVDAHKIYGAEGKPDPKGIFWPMPDHPSHPASKYDALPFVKKHPIMTADTPIGSAGSCFAFEIARVFQEMQFNYVVTERNDDPASGFGVDGYRAGDKYAKFCANYGILFNTPSFRQLAERAFGIKPTKKLLFQQPDGGWVDPYRESVLFFNEQAYKEDYSRHIAATRAALEQCEVFIVTLGLNECWQFRDGSVMSRNPRANMFSYVNHRTLTVQENVDNIQAFYDIVKAHNPKFKLIISVSPVPFLATGRADEYHVIAANTHSKSVLRVAADQLVANNENMYYLPSYELVMECIQDPWEIDTRHVKRSTVEQVVEMFKSMFIQQES